MATLTERLVGIKYPGQTCSVAGIHVRHARTEPRGLAVSAAFEPYSELVAALVFTSKRWPRTASRLPSASLLTSLF
jgi:hypothetical protein